MMVKILGISGTLRLAPTARSRDGGVQRQLTDFLQAFAAFVAAGQHHTAGEP